MFHPIKKMMLSTGIGLALCCAVLIPGTIYMKNVEGQLEQEISDTLQSVALQNVRLLNERVYSDMMVLKGAAAFVEESGEPLSSQKLQSILKNQCKNTRFLRITAVGKDGMIISKRTGEPVSIAGEEYFQRALAGETTIMDLMDEVIGEHVVIQSVPLYKGQETIGVLIGAYRISDVQRLMVINLFQYKGYHYIAKSDGTVLMTPDHPQADTAMKNLFVDFAERNVVVNQNAIDLMRENIKNGGKGEIFYYRNGTERIMNYQPVGINDWYLLSVVPRNVITARSAYLLRAAVYLVLVVLSAFALAGYYVFYLQKRNRQAHYLYQRRFEIIMEYMEDVLYEWDIPSDTVYFSDHFESKFGYFPPLRHFPDSMLKNGMIYLEDTEAFRDTFARVLEREMYTDLEVRIRKADQGYLWCRVTAASITDDEKQVCQVIGMISDINRQRMKWQEMEETAQRDPLTGLYNRSYTEQYIERYMSESGDPAALLVVDLDNFKRINDTMGHAAGDVALRQAADALMSVFRNTDIVGRIGGMNLWCFLRIRIKRSYRKRCSGCWRRSTGRCV